MRRIRIYHPQLLSADETATLNSDASKHLLQVLRKKVGDTFIVFDGSGAEFSAEIIGIEKKQAVFKVGQSCFPEVESSLSIHLGQAVSRGDRMDYAIQKAVELGVAQITPLLTEFCQVKLSKERFERKVSHWQSIAISATEQSGRCVVPTVNTPIQLTDWIGQDTSDLKYICCPRMTKNDAQDSTTRPKTASVIIGPEGGFSDAEVMYAVQEKFQSLSLGPRVLRTETAAVVALTLMQSRFGDV